MSLDEKRDQYTKWINRMTADPVGLEVIGAALQLNLKSAEEIKGQPIVAVLVPSYDGLEDKMMDTASRMVKYTQRFCTVFSQPVQGSSLIPWTRNHIQAGLHDKKYTHALMIDDDMELEEDYLVKMLRHEVDVVGCAYTTRTDPPVPNIHLIDLDTCIGNRVLHWNTDGLNKSPDPKKTLTCGTGLLLVKRHVFEKVAEFHVNCEYEKKYWKLTEEQIAPIRETRKKGFSLLHDGWWFELLPRLVGYAQCGEDVSFCIKAAMCGFDVHVDTSITPGHIGKYTYSMRDYLPFKESQIAKAKSINQYCEI